MIGIRTRLPIVEKEIYPAYITGTFDEDWPLVRRNGKWVIPETGEVLQEIDLVDLLAEREKEVK